MDKLLKLSIIIPTYNETFSIKKILQYVQHVKYPIDYEIIIIDDASLDQTYEKQLILRLADRLSDRRIRLFKNKINRGKGFSVRRGFRHATGDIFIVQDGDTEYDPHDIPKLIQPIIEDQADIVLGSRFQKNVWPTNMGLAHWLANHILTELTNILYGVKLTDVYACYKAMKASYVKNIRFKSARFEIDAEILAKFIKQKARIKELPISYQGRTSKQGKKIRAFDLLLGIWKLIRERF